MGKSLLIFVAVASLGGTIMLSQRMDTERVDTERKTLDEAQMIAREITESAYSLGTSRVQASFYERPLNGDIAYEGIAFGDGDYDLYVLELPCGAMRVTATGRMTVSIDDQQHGTSTTTQTHSMQGDYVALAEMPGAVLVDASVTSDVSVHFNDDSQISGMDRRPACDEVEDESWDYCADFSTIRSGMGGTQPQVVTNNSALQAIAATGVEESLTNTTSVGSFPSYVQDLYDDAYAVATMVDPDPYVHRYTSSHEFNIEKKFGSPTDPVVVLVEGDARFTGKTTGYGVLIVQGDFEAGSNFTWGGAVYVVKSGELDVRLKGDARVFGSLVVQNPDNGTGTSGPLHIHMENEAAVFYSAESVALMGDVMDGIAERVEIRLINERHTPATSFPQLECPGPDDDPVVEPDEACQCRDKKKKVGVMHFPPGNPDNAHLICISTNAWPAHDRNHTGDYIVCESD